MKFRMHYWIVKFLRAMYKKAFNRYLTEYLLVELEGSLEDRGE